MNALEEKPIQCPYCGETIDVLIDCTLSEQRYIEDCQVCCRPIDFAVEVTADNDIIINVYHENE